jgi:hypothetical protein
VPGALARSANTGSRVWDLDPEVTLVEKPFSESTLLDKVREVLDTPPPADASTPP